ncbi:protein FAM168A isoform X1 [Dermochelys coriacea]|uniref:protein FAM168A isoform X1 n=1 Tax=Dermochelys coriacea TaxID=27794 RepID=UPI001CAA2530|nr:protein FAM168A isoform X1 [Dermochelys coriacea]
MPPRGFAVPGAWPAGSCSSRLVSNGPAGGTLPPSPRPVPSPTRWLLWEETGAEAEEGEAAQPTPRTPGAGTPPPPGRPATVSFARPQSSQSSTMNPVYSPVQPGAPYGNPKNMAYTGYPTGYPTAAPAYNPNMYPTSSPGYAPEFQLLHSANATLLMKQAWPQTSSSCATEGTFHLPVDTGTENRTYQASSAAFRQQFSTTHFNYGQWYTAGTPYKVPPTQSNSAPPPYSPSPNPYQTAMYPIRSAYPQQNLYAQGAYYTQPVYAAQPHVIHHTTVVQPNSIPSAIYPAPVAAPRTNGVAMGMVAGTTMAMSAGTLLTTPQHTAIGAHPVSVPTYRAQGAPTYSYVPPHW